MYVVLAAIPVILCNLDDVPAVKVNSSAFVEPSGAIVVLLVAVALDQLPHKAFVQTALSSSALLNAKFCALGSTNKAGHPTVPSLEK